MYVHPQEIDYNIDTLFELIDASGLEFIGFSNPRYWQLERLIGKNLELMERAKGLSDREQYRLIELLDPEAVTHYEFFLGRPPIVKADWSSDDALVAAVPERNPCMDGWPNKCLFNYDYQIINLSEEEFEFLQACDENSTEPALLAKGRARTVGEILKGVQLEMEGVRSLLKQQLIMLTPRY
jgi:hypothetical protein